MKTSNNNDIPKSLKSKNQSVSLIVMIIINYTDIGNCFYKTHDFLTKLHDKLTLSPVPSGSIFNSFTTPSSMTIEYLSKATYKQSN